MRAREWKKAIQDERDRLEVAAEAERKHGDNQRRLAYEKAEQYEATVASLDRIIQADEDPNSTEDDDEDDAQQEPDPPNDLLVGKGSKAF
jgi:hypothetical protein